MIKAIIFDFDGTLVQSNEIKHNTYYKVARQLESIDINTQKIVDDVLTSGISGTRDIIIQEIIRRIAEIRLLPQELSLQDWAEKLTADYTKICEMAIASCPEIEGATTTLKHLKEREYLLFVNSATPKEYLERLVKLRKIEKNFTGIYGRPNDKIENLQAIFSTYSITPQQAVIVGDGKDDRQSALTMECSFIGVVHTTLQFSPPPAYGIHNFLEFMPILDEIENKQHKSSIL